MGIPVIASLNGVSMGGWLRYAVEMQQAGADALELNIYYIPADLESTGETVEQVIKRADQLLYESKGADRNRVTTD